MRVVRTIGTPLGGAVVFLIALSGGVVVHLDAPAMRRAVASRVNNALAAALPGRVVIERIGSIALTHVEGLDAYVQDPDGVTVARLRGARARISALPLVRSLIEGGDVRVDLQEVGVESADVNLDADASGTLRIVRAFVSQGPSTGSSRGVEVAIRQLRAGHVTARGKPAGAPVIDADVDALDGGIAVDPETLAIDVTRARLVARRLIGGAGATGDVEVHLARPSPRGDGLAARVAFAGSLGSVAISASAAYDGERLDAVADVPACTPEQLRGLWASCSFEGPTTAHAEAHGPLASLLVAAHGSVGGGELDVFGPVSLGGETRAALHFVASTIDAHALAAQAPSSDLGATGDVLAFVRPGGAVSSAFSVDFGGGRLGQQRLPPARLRGEASRGPNGALSGHVDATIREPGAPAQVSLRVAPKGDSFEVAFDASVDVPQLDRFARIGSTLRGRADAATHGTLDVASGRVDAQVTAKVDDVASGVIHLGTADLQAHVYGSLPLPRVEARLQGEGFEAPGLKFATIQAEAHGTPATAAVQLTLGGKGTDVSASADVGISQGSTLRNVRVVAQREGEQAVAEASLVRLAGAELRVDDAVVHGFGAPVRASVRASPVELEVHAQGRDVNLARVARFARLPHAVRGRLAIDADASIRASGATGHVVLDLTGGEIDEWRDASAHLDATIDGRRASGRLEARVGDVGQVEVQSTSIVVGGSGPLRPASLRTAWGALDVQGHVDLAKLAARLPLDRMRLHALSGTVDIAGRVARDSADDVTPDVDVTARTSGLLASGPADAPWHIEGTEATAHVKVDGRTGFTSVDGKLADAHGVLLAVEASSDAIPYAGLFLTDQPVLDLVRTMPFAAKVEVPARDLADLPRVLGTRGMHGELAASAEFRGSLLHPSLDARATLRRGRADAALLALPLDLAATGRYDGARADLTIDADTRSNPVLRARAAVDVAAADLLDGARAGPIPWKASGRATLSRFPLQSIAFFDDRQVRGHVSGELALDGLHDDAKLAVSLSADDVTVADVPCRSIRAQASIGGGSLDATARLDEKSGFAEAGAHVGAEWGSRLAPTFDASHPIDVYVTAKQFRAGLLLPLVSRYFAELDGRLDANARLRVDPATKTVRPEGTIDLHDGLFELASVGGEFHDASARIELSPDGVVRLENATARGLTGKLQAAATARFAAGAFAGARGVIQVPKQDPLPLIFQGVQVGMFDGSISLAVDPSTTGSGLDVNVDVPSAHVKLPEATAHDVEALGDIAGVRIGIVRPGNDFVPVELDGDVDTSGASSANGTPLRLAVHLGNDVEVGRGNDLDVRMTGSIVVTAERDLHASGQIRLLRGTIDVEGKPFTLEEGSVTFVDDPTNPQIKLRASWTAPDGTIVYADFVGPLKTGKPTLTSDPVLPKSEILSLILFGTPDQSPGTSSASSQTNPALGGAAGAAGGAATAPVNRALGSVNRVLDNLGLAGGISTKIDTSQTNPRPEVEVQIARDLSLQIAWVFGLPPPGTNPDQTLVTLSWHFLRQWSAQTTVGDAGTSILDLVWKHRY
jgi:translocation and assembly module TamB